MNLVRFHKLRKSSKRSESPPLWKIYVFPSDIYVCNFRLLYRKNINLERKKRSNLSVISFITPRNVVAKSTVAGWVKKILIMSGISIDIFKPYSTHFTSSSHGRLSVLSLSDTLKRGSCPNKTIWERFYNKLIMTSEEKFQKAPVNY